MSAYIARRILFMIPTLFGIMLVSFLVVQFAPGGPVERLIAQQRYRNLLGAWLYLHVPLSIALLALVAAHLAAVFYYARP